MGKAFKCETIYFKFGISFYPQIINENIEKILHKQVFSHNVSLWINI